MLQHNIGVEFQSANGTANVVAEIARNPSIGWY